VSWRGYCHGCRRYDVEVETRVDHAAKTLCDSCAERLPRRSLASPYDGRPIDLRVSDEEARAWRAEQRERYGDDDSGRLHADRRLASAPPLEKVARALRTRGLRPVIDAQLQLVLADCPDCVAQDRDRAAMWRPLRVVPRLGRVTYLCTACGAEEVRRA
jgi:hypothetical protein